MRILQITADYYPKIGGVERHVRSISEQLAGLGHDVVATMTADERGRPEKSLGGVRVRRFGSIGAGSAYRVPVGLPGYLWRARDRFDIVHVHNYHTAMLPVVAASGPHRLVVAPHLNDQAHSRVAELLHYPYAPVGRWSLSRASAVICVSQAERQRVLTRLRLAPERVQVVPNGVDISRFRRPEAGAARDPHLLLVAGRLEAYKRVDRAIAVLAALPAQFKLAIVGDGPLRSFLQDRAASLGVSSRVTFTGRVTDEQLVAWYRRASVLLHFSTAEAFGLTILEAIAAGCRVVCSDIPAFGELARRFPERITLVPTGDSPAPAMPVEAAACHPTTRPADLSAFGWDAVAERLAEVYQRVAGQQGFTGRGRTYDAHPDARRLLSAVQRRSSAARFRFEPRAGGAGSRGCRRDLRRRWARAL
jgi:glycosyltransferase involved in cell wall biosynthesis